MAVAAIISAVVSVASSVYSMLKRNNGDAEKSNRMYNQLVSDFNTGTYVSAPIDCLDPFSVYGYYKIGENGIYRPNYRSYSSSKNRGAAPYYFDESFSLVFPVNKVVTSFSSVSDTGSYGEGSKGETGDRGK